MVSRVVSVATAATIERVFVDAGSSHALTFGAEAASVWTLAPGAPPERRADLAVELKDRRAVAPVIADSERCLAVVAQWGQLDVFDLDTGALLHTLKLHANLARLKYSSRAGRALVAASLGTGASAYVLDVVGHDGNIGYVEAPPDLLATAQNDRCVPHFSAVHISDDGDVVCAFSRGTGFADTVVLLRWTATAAAAAVGPLDQHTPPTTRTALPVLLDDGREMDVSVTACEPVGSGAFLLCVREELPGFLWGPGTCQSVLRMVDAVSLGVSWTATLAGRVDRVHRAAASDLVLAFGEHNPADFDSETKPARLVAALDARSGALLRLERIESPIQGESPVHLVSHTQDAVFVLYNDGSLCVARFDAFVTSGLPRDGAEKLAVTRPWAPHAIQVVHAAAAASSVMVATSDCLSVVQV